jgi:hypothetical protein
MGSELTRDCSQLVMGVPFKMADRAIESINPPAAAAIKEMWSFTWFLQVVSLN